MGWYDFFSSFYDSSLEKLYREQREMAAEWLDLASGQVVVDAPCGTGQSFDHIRPSLGEDGLLIGVDLSSGMLAKAAKRVAKNEWSGVELAPANLVENVGEVVRGITERPIDRIHTFLGLTAIPEYEAAFQALWALLRPGGRFVLVDVHAAKPNFQGKMVNLVARADIRRRVWEPLEQAASEVKMEQFLAHKKHGGEIVIATGIKP